MPKLSSARFAIGIFALCAHGAQAGDSKAPQNPADPCTAGIAAYAAKLHTVCFLYPEQAAPDAKPLKTLTQNDGLHAGEQIACAIGSEVTITYCASRADVEVRAASGFSIGGPKPKRYIIANVPHKNPEEQPNIAPALRMAMEGTTEQRRYFVAGLQAARLPIERLGRKNPELQPAPDPLDQLAQLVERVKVDKDSAFTSLDVDGEWKTHGLTATHEGVGEIAYCAGSDGLVTAPKAIAGMHLSELKDSEGQPFGAVLAGLADPDVVTTLKSTWHFPGTAPVVVTTYASKVDDFICAVNVSKPVRNAKKIIPP